MKQPNNIIGEEAFYEDADVMALTIKPLYQHDCDKCRFLGGVVDNLGSGIQMLDAYHCPGSLGGSFILRYGNDGPEYMSGPVDVVMTMNHRSRRRILRGYLRLG